MNSNPVFTRPERPSDAAAIDALQWAAFGPGAYVRAAFRVREQAPHDPALSFVTEMDGVPIGSARLTPIAVGERHGHLLGPLVVDPAFAGLGHGKALVRHALAEAKRSGTAFVILVGDASYYAPLGFSRRAPPGVKMPGPVDPARLLVAELTPGAADRLSGSITGIRPGKRLEQQATV